MVTKTLLTCIFFIEVAVILGAPANTSTGEAAKVPSTYYEWESQLRQDLMKDYDYQVIPLKEAGKPLIVKVGLALNAVFKICPEKHKFSGNYFLRMEWEDLRLKWDPSKYGGIKTSHSFDMNDIWMPDITLYYGFTDIPGKFSRGPFTMVNSDGKVIWVPQVTIKVHCQPILPSSLSNGTSEADGEDHTKHHHHVTHDGGDEYAQVKSEKEPAGKDDKGGKGNKKARKNESDEEESDDEDEKKSDKKKKGKKEEEEEEEGKKSKTKKGGKGEGKEEGEGKDEEKKQDADGNKGKKGRQHQGHNCHGVQGGGHHKYDNMIEHCDIKFGSWIYDTKYLKVESFPNETGIDMSTLQYESKTTDASAPKSGGEMESKEKSADQKKGEGKGVEDGSKNATGIFLTPRHDMTWQILENKVESHVLKYPCCQDLLYSDLTFHLKLKKVHSHHHKHQGEGGGKAENGKENGGKKEAGGEKDGAKVEEFVKKEGETEADKKVTQNLEKF